MSEKNIYIVETVTVFRNVFAVSANIANSKQEAEDLVSSNACDEIGQKFLDEKIFSTREVTKEEYIKIFDEINDYLINLPEEKKLSFIFMYK